MSIFKASSQACGLARPEKSFHPVKIQTTLHLKKISAYIKEHPSDSAGLVQPQDKVVDRFALTIYPYSFDLLLFWSPSR